MICIFCVGIVFSLTRFHIQDFFFIGKTMNRPHKMGRCVWYINHRHNICAIMQYFIESYIYHNTADTQKCVWKQKGYNEWFTFVLASLSKQMFHISIKSVRQSCPTSWKLLTVGCKMMMLVWSSLFVFGTQNTFLGPLWPTSLSSSLTLSNWDSIENSATSIANDKKLVGEGCEGTQTLSWRMPFYSRKSWSRYKS